MNDRLYRADTDSIIRQLRRSYVTTYPQLETMKFTIYLATTGELLCDRVFETRLVATWNNIVFIHPFEVQDFISVREYLHKFNEEMQNLFRKMREAGCFQAPLPYGVPSAPPPKDEEHRKFEL